MAGVRFSKITKKFKSVVAVNELDLEIKDQEFMVLVGPSGCGKTTALRIIAGLEEPTGGEIAIGERVVNDVSPKDRDVAMVFQNYALYPHMTVLENIAFGLRLREMKNWAWQLSHWGESRRIRQDIDRRVQEAAKMLGLDQLLHRRPKELSGGQRQRVALARAIVRKPKVFLMDEPLSNLDAKLRDQTRAELKKLQENLGVTTVYVTHDQKEAMTLGSRIAIMKDGVLQQCDDPETVYRKPANMFVAGFIGSPQMNFFDATVVEEGGSLWVVAGGFRVAAAGNGAARSLIGKAVVFGVRPQDLTAVGSGSDAETLQAQVDVVEPHGDRTDLHLMVDGSRFVAQVDPSVKANEGDTLTLKVNLERAHLFDKETEAAVY